MNRMNIYVGDYVRFTKSYLLQWTSERKSRVRDLKDTIYLVTDICRCYNWNFGIGGGGMMLTLKPFLGPLAEENVLIGRGESSLEPVNPELVNDALERRLATLERDDWDSL